MNLTNVKYGIIAVFVVGVFVAILTGKIDATAGLGAITVGVGTLVVALGLTNAATKMGDALKDKRGFASLRSVVVLAAGGLALITILACKGPVFPTLTAIEQTVVQDLQAGKSDAQIASDVCADLGGGAATDAACAGVETVVADIITVLIDTGVLSGKSAENGKAYKARHLPGSTTTTVSPAK
jgi:hypothetical protein